LIQAAGTTLNPAFDLIVIGSGPAGIHASIQAAKIGKRVCVVEARSQQIGGAWIHTGTLPSKTLRETLATIQSIKAHAGQAWVDRIIDDLHTGKLFERARSVSVQEEQLVNRYLTKNRVEIVYGVGKVMGPGTVHVTKEDAGDVVLETAKILIATGSLPRRPPEVPFDGWRIIDGHDVLNLEQVPRTMAIFGAGVIGCEYACIFGALGVKVTLIDQRDCIMQYMDQEIVEELKKSMEGMNVNFILGQDATNIRGVGPKVLYICGNQELETDCFFHCAGRIPQSRNLGLEKLGVKISSRDAIDVDENFQTSVASIYAAGDVIGPPALAATAAEQGRHVVCHAFEASMVEFPKVFPYGVYAIPELSMVGKTEEELKKEGADYVVGRAFYSEIARGYIRGDSVGKVKILVDRVTHKLLGIHIVGADACNLIHVGLAFMMKDGHAQDLVNMIFNYPTLAEGYRIAAFNALNKIFTDGKIKGPPVEAQEQAVRLTS
jgi:NAD(P) transhydrogenase